MHHRPVAAKEVANVIIRSHRRLSRRHVRRLRVYGQRAKAAIEAGDVVLKANMILRADRLLTVMSGILDTSAGTTLGPAMMSIYDRLRFCLWKANSKNDCSALDDYDQALQTIDEEFLKLSTVKAERR
jgi:flagellin-specific chaperone FliS